MEKGVWAAVITVVGGLIGIFVKYILPPRPEHVQGPENSETPAYAWKDVERGVTIILTELKRHQVAPEAIITIAGSGGIVANLIKKALEAEHTERRLPLFSALLRHKKEVWPALPSYESASGDRMDFYVPRAICDLPKETTILVADSLWVTGSTVQLLRSYLSDKGYSNVIEALLVYIPPGELQAKFTQAKKPMICAFERHTQKFSFPWGPSS